MKFGATALGSVGLVALSSTALAQTPPPRTGFQMDIRTGYSVPLGSVRKDQKMSDAASGQVPILLDIGGKPRMVDDRRTLRVLPVNRQRVS